MNIANRRCYTLKQKLFWERRYFFKPKTIKITNKSEKPPAFMYSQFKLCKWKNTFFQIEQWFALKIEKAQENK